MGAKGVRVVETDVIKLIELLNKAFADEWLAYYQYWIGAQVIRGTMRTAIMAELLQHAQDELRHAEMVSKRIIQLGGTPLLEPKQWYTYSNCGFMAPSDPHEKTILLQNIKGEQCAIDVYEKLLDITKDKDIVTYNMVVGIFADEVEHEDDLQTLLDDLNLDK